MTGSTKGARLSLDRHDLTILLNHEILQKEAGKHPWRTGCRS
jgi:hypothetical protein